MNSRGSAPLPEPHTLVTHAHGAMQWLKRHARLLAVLSFTATILLVVHITGIREHFGLDVIRAQFESHLISGTATFVLLFALGNLIQIPGWIFLAAAVLSLGQVWGAAVTYVAAVLSCTLVFVLIRCLGGSALREIDNRLARSLLTRLDKQPIRSQFLLRTLFQTAPALNYALALSGVGLRHYVLGLLAGLPLPIVLYSVFFDYLAMALDLI
tara:strand:- start:2351 stop:2986 length:636 start_codon:yes stop_codon:yes gene_type:complete